ncbi:MAG: glycosyltransferase [Candidatus Margulisbacteria bacterium]|nr:glycosyltransferase [Candidatus Margulisiibacteriota bacterium]MBU1021104.1 glycosyltransferase [Candidatus Margulisiibacteriota bacterium]MBU1728659.1 glycosyltransferase [Candidatus Margulisiibacteriota bacterium]MBU1955110.1 glycosyltransferase [Candidatus Margulisiibacteriota bacterium]
MTDLAIVIPVYNEGESFRKVFDEIHSKVKTSFKIYAVYDFDEDTTAPIIKNLAQQYPQLIMGVRNNYGRGVVGAIKTGFETACEPVILVTMGDLSDDLSDVDKMFSLIKNQGYDVVCGSRYMKGGRQEGGPKLKKLLSRFAGLSLKLLSGLLTHDPSNSFKMYRRSVLQSIALKSDGGFEIGMEITVKAFLKGYKITEIPTIWKDRTAGKSNFKLVQWIPKYLRWYFLAVSGRIKQLIAGRK